MNVFVACPTHDGRIYYKTAEALYDKCSVKHQLLIAVGQTSLLNYNCNQLWCQALNMRVKHHLNWFAMLHSDVVPEPYWLDRLIDQAEMNGADMLSACIAIKDEGGDISAGVSNPSNHHLNHFRLNAGMLSLLPVIFGQKDLWKLDVHSDAKLLVNTGCCIVRMDRPWISKLVFKGSDHIVSSNDQFTAVVDPEDWNFSRQVHDHGGKVMATQILRCGHIGVKSFTVKSV